MSISLGTEFHFGGQRVDDVLQNIIRGDALRLGFEIQDAAMSHRWKHGSPDILMLQL